MDCISNGYPKLGGENCYTFAAATPFVQHVLASHDLGLFPTSLPSSLFNLSPP